MKILRIKDNQGFYTITGDEYIPIDKVGKNDLLALVELALGDDFEIDSYSDDILSHQSHQIIYKSISEKLLDLNQRKDEFKDESERLYLEEYEKYKAVSSS
ncbi:MAG: hypothetical protein JAY95_00675 [Candidatus Thiodiazotropha taylori]|nr:hypothetical protein [Candidatus Thiodiazotropha taylori]